MAAGESVDSNVEAGDVSKGREFRRFGCLTCKEDLYMVGELEPGVWARASDSPKIVQRDGSFFMTCKHCGAVTEFELAPAKVGVGLKVKRLVE